MGVTWRRDEAEENPTQRLAVHCRLVAHTKERDHHLEETLAVVASKERSP